VKGTPDLAALDFPPPSTHLLLVSVAELQRNIANLPAGPRRSVAKYVAYLKRRDAPSRRRLLAAIGGEMDQGKSFSQAEVDAALMRRPPRR